MNMTIEQQKTHEKSIQKLKLSHVFFNFLLLLLLRLLSSPVFCLSQSVIFPFFCCRCWLSYLVVWAGFCSRSRRMAVFDMLPNEWKTLGTHTHSWCTRIQQITTTNNTAIIATMVKMIGKCKNYASLVIASLCLFRVVHFTLRIFIWLLRSVLRFCSHFELQRPSCVCYFGLHSISHLLELDERIPFSPVRSHFANAVHWASLYLGENIIEEWK